MDGLDKRVTKLEERLKKENGEEMGKLRGRGEMTEEVCTICGRTFEAVKGGTALTCSEACTQKLGDGIIRVFIEFAEWSDKRWASLWSSIEEEFGVTMPPLKPTAIIIEEAMREYLKGTK